MSRTVDQKVVQMQFDNQGFEQGAKQSMSTLEKLKAALKFDGASKGVDELNKSVKSIDFTQPEIMATKAGFHIQDVFLKVSNVLEYQIARKIINIGENIAKSLTLDQVTAGFNEYQLKMDSVNTIMASTGEKIEVVNGYLEELNHYSDKTIYSFSDMTQNIGKFTNAGVKLHDAVSAIQGVANVAAVSGANANEASRAMYNFAQALSAGYVKLIDWRSIETANMATVEFKDTLLQTAVAMGTVKKDGDDMYKVLTKNMQGKTMDQAINTTKNFNDSLNYQWMTTGVLTQALEIYSKDVRDMTWEEKKNYEQSLRKKGFTLEQVKAFEDLGIKATDAATKVRTFSQLFDAIKESIGSGWAMAFENVIGDLNEARDLLTDIKDIIDDVVTSAFDSLNGVLKSWKKEGGRDVLVEAFMNLVQAITNIVSPLKQVFQEIFPPMTVSKLLDITNKFRDWTEAIKLNIFEQEDLRIVLHYLAFPLKVIVEVIGVLLKLAGSAIYVLGSILRFIVSVTANVIRFAKNTGILADMVSKTDTVLKTLYNILGNVIKTFKSLATTIFNSVVNALKDENSWLNRIIDLLRVLGSMTLTGLNAALNAIANFKFSDVVNALENMKARLTELAKTNVVVKTLLNILAKLKEGFKLVADAVIAFANHIKENLESVKSFSDFLGVVWEAIKDGTKVVTDFIENKFFKDGPGLFETIKNGFLGFIDVLKGGLKEIPWAKLVLIGFSLALAACVINLVTAISKFGSLASALAQTISIINTTVKSFLTLKTKLTELSAIGVFIASITFAIGIISWIDKENGNLTRAAATLAIVAGGLMIFAEAMLWINAKNALSPASMASLLASIGALVGGVAVLAMAAAALKDMSMTIENALPYLKTLGVLMVGMLGAMTVLTLIAKDHKVFTAGAMSILSYAASVYILANALRSMADIKFPNIKDLLKVLAEIFAGFAALMLLSGKIGFMGDKGMFQFKSGGFSMLAFAASLKLLAMGLTEISQLTLTQDAEKVLNMLKDLATKLIVFGSIVIVITKVFGKTTKTANILKSNGNKLSGILNAFSLTFLSIAASFFIIAKTFETLKDNLKTTEDKGLFIATIATFAACIIALTFVFKAIAKANEINPNKNSVIKFALSLTLLTTALVPLALVLDLLSSIVADNHFEDIAIATSIIVAMGLLMGRLMAMSGKLKPTSFKSILTIFAGMSALLAELIIISMLIETKGASVLKALGAFAGIALAMGILIRSLSSIEKKIGHINVGSIIAITASLVVFAGVLTGLTFLVNSGMDVWKAMGYLGAIVGVMDGALAVLALIKKHIGPLGETLPALIGIVGSIVVLAGVLVGLAITIKTYGDEINGALKILGVIGLGLVAVMAILTALQTSGGEGNWTTLLSLAGIIVAIAGALILMAQVPWDNLKGAAIVLGSLVVVMGLLAAGLGVLNTVIPGSVLVFNAFARALGVLAAGMGVLVAAAGAFIYCVSKLVDSLREIGLCGDQVADGLRKVGPAIADAIKYIAVGISDSAPLIAQAVKVITDTMVVSFAEGMVTIAQAIADTLDILTPALTEAVVTVGKTLMSAFIESIGDETVLGDLTSIGNSWIGAVLKGLAPGYNIFYNIGNAFKTLFLKSATPTSGEMAYVEESYTNAYAGAIGGATKATLKELSASETKIKEKSQKVPATVIDTINKAANSGKGHEAAKSFMNDVNQGFYAGWKEGDVLRYKTQQGVNSLLNTLKSGGSLIDTFVTPAYDRCKNYLLDLTSGITDGIPSVEEYTKQMEEAGTAATGAGAAMEGAGKSASKGAKGVKEAADEVSNYIEKMENSFNIFEEFKLDDEENPLTGDQLLQNMQSNIDGMTQWANEMVGLAGKMSEGLYQKLADMGPEGYKYVHAFASMTEEQLMQVNQLYAQSLIIPTSVTAQIYQGMATASSNAYTGFIRGLNIPALQMQGVSLATTFLAGVNDGFGITSYSTKMYDKGVASTQGLTSGINDSGAQSDLKSAANTTGTGVVDEVDATMGEKAMVPIGQQTASGLATGIRAGKSEVINAAAELAAAAKNTVTTDLKIQSPSKVFAKLGGYIDEGLAKGITDNTDLVNGSMSKLADSAVDNMAGVIATIQSAVDTDMDVEPVIRPVVDLSNVQNGSRSISSLMKSNFGSSVTMPASRIMSSSEMINMSDNADVVHAINSLKSDVNALGESISNIKMVLDTGTLVGAMTPVVDKRLGIRKMYAERGI